MKRAVYYLLVALLGCVSTKSAQQKHAHALRPVVTRHIDGDRCVVYAWACLDCDHVEVP